jgi:hypothetical protein
MLKYIKHMDNDIVVMGPLAEGMLAHQERKQMPIQGVR